MSDRPPSASKGRFVRAVHDVAPKLGNDKRTIFRRVSSRSSISVIPDDKVTLEQVLGVSATSNNSLSYDVGSGNILYTAGCVCVLYNIKRSKQTHIKNTSKKPLTCAAFSSDGKLIVTGESGHQPCVRVWDVQLGTQLSELHGHRFGVSSVSFSPNCKVVVSVGFSHDSNVSVWNWKSGKQVAGNKVSSRVFGMSYNEAGTYFVTVGVRFVKFWYFDTNNDKALTQLNPCENRAAILDNHRNTTFKAVVCGRGQFALMTFCLSNDGRLFSFGESRRIERWLDLKVNDAFALYVTSDYLLCGCSDGVVRIFEPATLSHIVNLPKPHPLGVDLAACTSPSCMVAVLPTSNFPDCIGVVADTESNRVIALYRDKSLYIWDITNYERIGKYRSYLFHSACICAIEVYPQDYGTETMPLPPGTFITGSSDNTIRIWNLTNLEPDSHIKRNIYSKELLNQIYTDRNFSWLRAKKSNSVGDNANGITALAISPRGDVIASGDRSGNLRVHDLMDVDCAELVVIEAHDAEILSLSFTKPDGYWHYLASASRDRLIHVFDVRNDYVLIQTINDHSAIVTSVKFVERPADSQLTLLTCSADKSVRFRTGNKLGNHQLQFQTYQHVQEKSTLNDMEIPPCKTKVTTGCQDRFIRTYDLVSGKCVGSFKVGGSEDSGMIVNVALDPSGTYIAAAGSDKCIFVHEFNTGEKVASLYGHSEMITGMKFTNDCKRLLSISGDGCIFVWRLNNEVVRSIKNKMRGLGFEPEISADTPNPNRKGETLKKFPLSPPNENVRRLIPHDNVFTPIEGSGRPATISKSISEPKIPSKLLNDSSSDVPTSPRCTPEFGKRKRWDKPNTLNFLEELPVLDSGTPSTPLTTPQDDTLTEENCTPLSTRIRGDPDGGEEDEPVQPTTDATVSPDPPPSLKTLHRPVPLPPLDIDDDEDDDDEDDDDEDDDNDDNSEGDTSPSEVIYAPPKNMSPILNNKRHSQLFDVNITPLKQSVVGLSEDEEESHHENGSASGEIEDEEDEAVSDSFLKHKFSEIEEESDIDADLLNKTLSPKSALRQSMSRKFYKTGSPEKQLPTEPDETPKSKASSSISSAGSPDKIRQAVEEKLHNKRKEKYSLKQAVTSVMNSTLRSNSPKPGGPLLSNGYRADSDEFIIHRRPSLKGAKLDLSSVSSYERRSSDGDSTASSKYVSLSSKPITSDSKDTSDRSDKATKGSKSGFKNKFLGGKKKEEKSEKASKKAAKVKSPFLSRKDVSNKPPKTDAVQQLQKSLDSAFSHYDTLVQEPQSEFRDRELQRARDVFVDMMERLSVRVPPVENKPQGDMAELRAAKCAEVCADRILELVKERLRDT